MTVKRGVDDISREEDYRDYNERDISEGWPYDDASGAGGRRVANSPYGHPSANFDNDRNRGYSVDSAEASGLEERIVDSVLPGTAGLEDSDDLEERVTDAIDNLELVPIESIDVHAEPDGSVTITGQVDDAASSRRIQAEAEKIAGVTKIINNLRLAGVDTHIPADD